MSLGLLTLVIHLLVPIIGEDQFYTLYANSIYTMVRYVYDYSFGYLPFPSIYILFAIFLFWTLVSVIKLFKSTRIIERNIGISNILIRMLNFFGWLIFLFYFLWGFNYYRPNIDKELNFKEYHIDSTDILREFDDITKLLMNERTKISIDTHALNISPSWVDLENEIRIAQKKLLTSWGQRYFGRVRIRDLRPKGSLLIFSTAGIYFPFVCEGHVDPGMNELQYPFTIAHEMAHGHGYTDEGVCNFIGFLTCMTSVDPYIRYSGLLGYWRYLYFEISLTTPQMIDSISLELPKGIKNDLIAIRQDLKKYPDILPRLRNLIYDSYLKTHGVNTGLQSYDEIISQVIKWKKSNYAFPLDSLKNE